MLYIVLKKVGHHVQDSDMDGNNQGKITHCKD